VKPHEYFKKEGLNVTSEIPISITEAILGSKVTVETLDGRLNIDLKPGTNTGQEFVLKHHGMPPFSPPENYDVN
jgi:molecular chaperone DnaJ